MADSDLGLLFKIRGDSAGAKAAVADTRAAISQLRNSFGSEFGQIQNIANSALGSVTSSLTNLTGHIPIVGSAVQNLGTGLGSMAVEGEAAAGALAGIAAPAALAVVGIGALVAGIGLLGKELFSLAESAAAFRGKLFDLSQQTGVNVETLNALDIAASKTGGSIESVAQSLVIFQGKIEEAQDPASKAGKLFNELGISTDNTERSLREAAKALAAMPKGFEQTNTAAELFGRRGGKQFLAILKETHGDIDSAVRQLGLLARVTEEDGKQADDFNDAMRDLTILLRGALGKEVIPAATVALKDLSRTLQQNQDIIQAVGLATKVLASFFVLELRGALNLIEGTWKLANIQHRIAAEQLERILAAMRAIGAIGPPKPFDFSGVVASVSGSANTSSVKDTAAAAVVGTAVAQEAEKARQAQIEASAKKAAEELKRQLDYVLKLHEALKPLRDQIKGVDTETHAYAVEQNILNGILKDASPALQEEARNYARRLDNLEKQLKLQNQLKEFLEKQNEQVREAIEGTKGQIAMAVDFITSLEKQGGVLQQTTKDQILFNASILAGRDALKLYQETLDAIQVAGTELPGLSDKDIAARAGAAANAQLGPPPAFTKEMIVAANAAHGAFTGLGVAISETLGLSESAGQAIGETLAGAFSQLANAVGQAVQSFVLFGKVEGGFRKFAAELIASIAAAAAVQAVYELAQGLAWTALNAFFPNPAYAKAAGLAFASAAVFGSIAGVATVAGRGIAGGAFAQAGGGGNSSSRGDGKALQTIETGRNQRGPHDIASAVRQGLEGLVLRAEISRDEGSTVRMWISDYKNGGRTRQVIANDGQED
jgi:hypothetical protein